MMEIFEHIHGITFTDIIAIAAMAVPFLVFLHWTVSMGASKPPGEKDIASPRDTEIKIEALISKEKRKDS